MHTAARSSQGVRQTLNDQRNPLLLSTKSWLKANDSSWGKRQWRRVQWEGLFAAPVGGKGMPPLPLRLIDWCCFYYFVRTSLVALLEALCARIFSFRCVNLLCFWFFFFCECVCKVSNKALLPPPSTRLLCLVVSIPLVCWLYMCACVRVPLYVHVKMCR